jgi:DNA repair exonuclease SbcCD nuclease subunit
MLKILLTSDIHLGAGEEVIPGPVRVATFKRICALAGEHDLLLIAGDLFHCSSPPEELVDMVAGEFGALKAGNVEVVHTPGECELDADGLLPAPLLKTGASHVFSAGGESAYTLPGDGQDVIVYGFPATARRDLSRLKKLPRDGFHIGLFHANFVLEDDKGVSGVTILQKRDIRALNLDFYALGHQHHFKLLKLNNRIIGAYPGSPEALSFSESGDRFVLSISVENSEVYQIKRLAVNSMDVRELSLECGGMRSLSDLVETLDKYRSQRSVLKLNLEGERSFILGEETAAALARGYYRLSLTDRSFPSLEILMEEFGGENSMRGEFYRSLKERLQEKGIPDGTPASDLARVLHGISRGRRYAPEEWLC